VDHAARPENLMSTETKSKEYMRPISVTWWLQRWAYTKFMIRDVTSIFIAGYCVFLMVMMCRANQGAEAFRAFYESLRSPLSVVLHAIALIFAVIHSVTFFNLTPRVIVLFRGDEKVPEGIIAGLHYAMWGVVSLVLLILALW
jgi:succinate dehydrogenase subunit C